MHSTGQPRRQRLIRWRSVSLSQTFWETQELANTNALGKCSVRVQRPSLAALGKKIASVGAQSLTIKAFAGSFKACYPSPKDHSHVKAFAKKIVSGMGKPMKYPDALFPKAEPCTGVPGQTSEARARFVASFRQRFPAAVQEVAQAHPEVHKALASDAKNCQSQCLSTTLSLAVQNLWDSGRFAMSDSEALSIDALTGAVQACFPEVAHHGVNIFVHQVVDALNDDLDFVRLHTASDIGTKEEVAFGSYVLLCTFGVCMISLAAICLVVIRWKRRAHTETEQEREVTSLLPEEVSE